MVAHRTASGIDWPAMSKIDGSKALRVIAAVVEHDPQARFDRRADRERRNRGERRGNRRMMHG